MKVPKARDQIFVPRLHHSCPLRQRNRTRLPDCLNSVANDDHSPCRMELSMLYVDESHAIEHQRHRQARGVRSLGDTRPATDERAYEAKPKGTFEHTPDRSLFHEFSQSFTYTRHETVPRILGSSARVGCA